MSVRSKLRRNARRFRACFGFGTACGIVTGAIAGAVFAVLGGLINGAGLFTLAMPVYGGIGGGLLGLGGGLVAGLLGSLLGGRLGWGLAGAIGGAASATPFALSAMETVSAAWVLSVSAIPVVIGGLLGVAVADGVERRRSPLPGVAAFALELERVGALPPRPGEALPAGHADLLPAAAPAARGDEATPATERRDA